jgi:uncharacterized repeat protein (TIGR03803 family)
MTRPEHTRSLEINLWPATSALILTLVFVLAIGTTPLARAQTFTVLHNFTGGQDGANPRAGVTIDGAGNLYGTTYLGGTGNGTVYRMKRSGLNWISNPLFSFDEGDGANPEARVIFGPDGLLYGTTLSGGSDLLGTVFNLKPSPSACKAALCPWTETVLYDFLGYPFDGESPHYGDLIFDRAGNIYGTTADGGFADAGVVYELTPSGSGWTESVLYSFGSFNSDGANPLNGVILDSAGNLYGTTLQGGTSNYGTVFQLRHIAGSNWTEIPLYNFDNGSDGSYPYAGLIFDQSGNLYGTTSHGGMGYGTVFELLPAGGSWTYSVLYSFTGPASCASYGNLAMDAAGNLYGTRICGGAYGLGSVLKLTPSNSGWTYTDLHDFTGGGDGAGPYCNVTFDANGNLYGTASAGGSERFGVVWEITP